jgi:Lrp/AsnC family leucine-responsive transcriptional regulator
MKKMDFTLDKTDLYILRRMQDNARIPNKDLAKELDMAPSAVLERVKKLEQKKVISHYRTAINPTALDQKLLAFIFIRTSDNMGRGESGLQLAKIPEVQEVHHIAGEDCYLVKVRTVDAASLMELMRNQFGRIPGLLSTRTTIVLETIKEGQNLVIPKMAS